MGTYISGTARKRSKNLNNSAISSNCQFKVNDILAYSNRLEDLFKAYSNGSKSQILWQIAKKCKFQSDLYSQKQNIKLCI